MIPGLENAEDITLMLKTKKEEFENWRSQFVTSKGAKLAP